MTASEHLDTLPALVARAARRWPGRVAWVFAETGTELTFGDIDARSDKFASVLFERGVRGGDRVAVMLRNRPEFPLAWLAASKLGCAAVPVNVNYRSHDATHVLRHSEARLVVTSAEFTPLIERIRPDTALTDVLDVDAPGSSAPVRLGSPCPQAETVANIQYTSGTTGAPKGCVLPHRYWTTLARNLVDCSPHLTSDDVILTAQPFHYMDPQWNVAVGLLSGARFVVLDRFHPLTFWAEIRRHGVTWFYCLGMMPSALLAMPASAEDRDHSVRAVSASAVPPERHAELEKRWGAPWFEAFGMTETGSDLRVLPEDHDAALGTGCIGRPLPGREAMAVDDAGEPVGRGEVGELVLRGTGMMHGYFRDRAATDQAFRGGWFHTGDLVRVDPSGLFYYRGRIKDMIRRSGENVSAAEVESVIEAHADVSASAVLAEPDELRGEEVHAVVVLADGVPADAASLRRFCAERLAYFKVPRYWTFVSALPVTASERVSKPAVRQQLQAMPAGSTVDLGHR